MILVKKNLNISNQISFRIPSLLRDEMNLTQGSIVEFRIQNDSIIIKVSNEYTTEISSTVGEGGQIYLPIEARRYFQSKGIENFRVSLDQENKNIILKSSYPNKSYISKS